MADITEEEIKKAITDGINQAIDVKTKDFYIGREEHYQHHQFIKEFIELMKTSKKTATRVIIATVVISILGLLASGFWQKIVALFK